MFRPLGLFKDVECPNQDECNLPACIFLHHKTNPSNVTRPQEYDPLSISYDEGPPPKKLKTEHAPLPQIDTETKRLAIKSWPEKTNINIAHSQVNKHGIGQSVKTASTSTSQYLSKGSPVSSTLPTVSKAESTPAPSTATRSISPPPLKNKTRDGAKKANLPKEEDLIPRTVPSQPVQFSKRDEILKKFYAQLQLKNKMMTVDSDPELRKSMPSEQELIKFALDREQEAAIQFEGTVYQSHLGRQMVLFKKMGLEEWKAFVQDTIRKKERKPQQKEEKPQIRTVPGLNTPDEEIAILRAIRTSLAGLEKFGYVSIAPTAQEIASALAAIESSAGWEECNRCNTRFRVFPGRNEEGRLTSGGKCRYHWARPSRPPMQKIDRVTGGGQILHPCCGQSPGTDGCTVAESHVFCVKDPSRLASIFQFESTPLNDKAVKGAVSFDCEMGYTTLGMEVIRVTAVSWPSGKELLDVLVRPYGEILDFNTRFSGVTQKQYAEAVPHGGGVSTEGGRLLKVASPAAARSLLFDLISPETPLIGHAIDNDLNTLRIIHPLIVDTVLLYPHPKGLPARFSLKVLVKQHLDRDIQTSGAAGHDSKEDAIATGDLVTLRAQEKWRQMQVAGWKFHQGKLVAPAAKIARTPS
ncbi:hypothetical protein DV735_g2687, partial [Chaetothyriales sp. CBS 134920]